MSANTDPCAIGLETTVHGSVDEAREFARWLRKQAHAVGDLASTFKRSYAVTASWDGAASDAYQEYSDKLYRDLLDLERGGGALGTALDNWSDDISTVKSRMAQYRQWARDKGLTVTGNTIQPPLEAAPTPPGDLPDNATPQQISKHEQAGIDYANAKQGFDDRQATFDHLTQAVSDARGMERAAQEAAQDAFGESQFAMNGLIAVGGKAATTALAFSGSVADESKNLARFADETRARAVDALQRMKSGQVTNVAAFEKAWTNAVHDKEKFDRTQGKMPMQKYASKALDFDTGLPLLRRLPVLGTVASGSLAGVSIIQGAPAGEAITRLGTSTGAAMAADWGVGLLFPEGKLIRPAVRVIGSAVAGEAGDSFGKHAYDQATKESSYYYDHLGEK